MSVLIEQQSLESNKELLPRLFSVAEFNRMEAAGVFHPEERLELIEGTILTMSPKGIKHAACNDKAARYLETLVGKRAIIRNQNPIQIGEFSEPQPDLVVAAPVPDKYFEHHPTPSEIFLVMEISSSSLSYDLGMKSKLYAHAGIPEYFIINLIDNQLIDLREAGPDGYHKQHTYIAGQTFQLVALPEITIQASELLLQ